MSQDFTSRINASYGKMSKGQKLIANFILNNYDKAAFMTALTLGKSVGVSESTVVRFADSIGYAGYPELQKELQDTLRIRLTGTQRMELSENMQGIQLFEKVLKTDIDNLRTTFNEIDKASFEATVTAILTAKRVYIMGVRSAAAIVRFFGYYLEFMLDDVRTITEADDNLVHITNGDVFIGISFPRYSERTAEAMRYAKSRGARCIALTDSAFSPLSEFADIKIDVKCDTVSFFDSLVAPLSVVNAILAAVSTKKKTVLSENLKEMESIWYKNNLYATK